MHPRGEKGGEPVAGPPDRLRRSDADGVEALRPRAAHEFGFQIDPAALHLRHHRIGGPIWQNLQPILVVKSSNIMEIRLAALLKHFQEKWNPVFRPKMRQNKELEPHSDSIGMEKTLVNGVDS
jgi:hypothetical protein